MVSWKEHAEWMENQVTPHHPKSCHTFKNIASYNPCTLLGEKGSTSSLNIFSSQSKCLKWSDTLETALTQSECQVPLMSRILPTAGTPGRGPTESLSSHDLMDPLAFISLWSSMPGSDIFLESKPLKEERSIWWAGGLLGCWTIWSFLTVVQLLPGALGDDRWCFHREPISEKVSCGLVSWLCNFFGVEQSS